MDWLKKHLGNLFHAAADLVEKHPDIDEFLESSRGFAELVRFAGGER